MPSAVRTVVQNIIYFFQGFPETIDPPVQTPISISVFKKLLSEVFFVMKHALGGGATMSLRLDSLGKSMGSAVMRMKIHVEDGEL